MPTRTADSGSPEQQYEAEVAALRAAIDEGDASGIAEGDVFERVRQMLKLPSKPR